MAIDLHRLVCRVLGHRWIEDGETVKQGTAWARIGIKAHRSTLVPVAWYREAVCGRCRDEEWTPW